VLAGVRFRVFRVTIYERYTTMQTIGPPKDNGTLDNILVQADGKTGDHVDRQPAQAEAFKDSGEVQVPEQNQAAKYDGQWKGL
jgi:hypothetical protein